MREIKADTTFPANAQFVANRDAGRRNPWTARESYQDSPGPGVAFHVDAGRHGQRRAAWAECMGRVHGPSAVASRLLIGFTGVDLIGVDLTGVDLTGVDLTGVDLIGVDLIGVDVTGVDLTEVDLAGVDFAE